jgi:hypothetical protein
VLVAPGAEAKATSAQVIVTVRAAIRVSATQHQGHEPPRMIVKSARVI